MSKNKGAKTHKPASKGLTNTVKNADIPTTGTTGLSEDKFQNLKDKISAQLKIVDQKSKKERKKVDITPQRDGEGKRGKKRAADGTIVTSGRRKETATAATENTKACGADSDSELQAAVQELGGTNEDLVLIAGADSESELEGLETDPKDEVKPKKKGSTLQDGIKNILKEIELAKGIQEHESEDSEEGDDNNDAEESTVQGTNVLQRTSSPKPVAKQPKKKLGDSRFKCQPRADWFNTVSADVDLELESQHKLSQKTVDELHAYAKKLLDTENEVFKNTQQSSSSQAFYNTVIASGTLSDKISALTLAVQESPIHNVKALENLINLAGKRSRAQAVDVLRALKDLFAQGSLLPGDRRLHTFATQPALVAASGRIRSWKQGDKLPRGIQESDLICWAFEDWLKQQYFEILRILEVWCNDEIEFAKGRAVSYVYELLKEKPEQESNLLRLLVNKLGDPIKKIASQTSYLLMQLLSIHPAMKTVVISAIETDFIFRPGQSMHGKYYAVVTINQTALSSREDAVARKLLDIYFGLFTALLKPSSQDQNVPDGAQSQSRAQRQRKKKSKTPENTQGEELREKLISAVLTGVNRAYPYVGTEQKDFANHMETLFRVTHSANFNTSIQAMLLIQQLTSTHSASSDRFYRTLYESLLDPRLITASKQQLYLNLLHRSLKADVNTKRIKAFVKRLLQILSLHEPSFTCGVFFLLKDLERAYPSLTALIDQAEDQDDEEEVFQDVDEDSNAAATKPSTNEARRIAYDSSKRAPEYANADNSCAWEILPFLAHFHPAVTVSADHYIQHSKLPGKPDLTLHTLIHFLDRFVYRNPKLASNKLRGSSIMQPMASDDTHAVLISSNTRQTLAAVNTEEFKSKKNVDVAAEDAFFHKYFTTLGKEVKTKKRKEHDADVDGSVGDEGEDAVWKAMMDSAPDLEGEGSDDEDIDLSEFEDEMDEDSSGAEDIDFEVEDADGRGDDDEVDIEAGIFDDSDDELVNAEASDRSEGSGAESDFEGLESDAEQANPEFQKKKEKRKADKDKRKKMKALPTFASAADYAKMLEDDEDEDLG